MTYIEAIKNYIPVNSQEESDQKIILKYIESFNHNILTRDNEIAHLTSSAVILNHSLNKMLMIHHNIYKTWTWTGGHADGEPDMLAISIKEALEETGLEEIEPLCEEVASIDIIPVYGHIKRGIYVSSHLHLNVSYILLADDEASIKINLDETTGVEWISIEKIPQYSNEPYLIDIYNKLIHKTKILKGLHP